MCSATHSRYDLGEEHAREKERYAAKEREEVIRRSKERRLAEAKVSGTVVAKTRLRGVACVHTVIQVQLVECFILMTFKNTCIFCVCLQH